MSAVLKASNQRCGIELEMYVKTSHIDNSNGRNQGVIVAKEFMKENNVKGLTALRDLSLRSNCDTQGVELKFGRPNMLKSSLKKIDALCDMANKLNATFMETEGTFIGSKEAKEKTVCNDGNYNGSTGLHVHFEVPKAFSALDFIRLIQFHTDNYNAICKMAWRENSHRWAGSAKDHLDYISHIIAHGNNNSRWMGSPEGYVACNHINNLNKYTGLNLRNTMSRTTKRTVEFRYGHGALALDKKAFVDYVEYLKTTWDDCFTGETEMDFQGYHLVDKSEAENVKMKTVSVFKDGKHLRDITLSFTA